MRYFPFISRRFYPFQLFSGLLKPGWGYEKYLKKEQQMQNKHTKKEEFRFLDYEDLNNKDTTAESIYLYPSSLDTKPSSFMWPPSL